MTEACRPWRERITRQLDGELPKDERQALAAHLEGCADCRLELDAQQRLKESWTAWPSLPSRTEDRAAIVAAAHAAPGQTPGWRERVRRVLGLGQPQLAWGNLVAGAALTVTVVLAFELYDLYRDPGRPAAWPRSVPAVSYTEYVERASEAPVPVATDLELPSVLDP